MNYGELIEPVPLPEIDLVGAAGQGRFASNELQGRWTLLYAGAADCGPACVDALYTMRQSRLAQAKEMERVGRLWLVSDARDPDPAILGMHDGLRIARADSQWLAALPGAGAQKHIYLVDPLGNVMMRFPEQADPRRVIKDLQRLLKYSALGRG
jgi:cytochrome oxidase Cu insertion factor (SCO1/SenC/PrrC family)